MSKLILDSGTVATLSEFCDVDTLTNRIELVDDLKDNLLEQIGETEDEAEKKKLTDWMLCLHDMNNELKTIRRAQR